MAVQLTLPPKFQAFDASGNPLNGGKLWTYNSGTTTPLASYTDSTGGTPNANPVILNSRGEADVWLTEGTAYRLRLLDANDVQIWQVDGISMDAAPASAELLPSGVTITKTTGTFTASTGASTLTLAGFLDAGKLILGVTLNVTQQFGGSNGLAGLSLGDTAQIDRWGGGLTLTTGLKTLRQGGLPVYATAQDLVLSAEGGTFDATGAATATKYVLALT